MAQKVVLYAAWVFFAALFIYFGLEVSFG